MSAVLRVGFTGTRHGMTGPQKRTVRGILAGLAARHARIELHEGDCVGSDDEAAQIGREVGCWVVAHPPQNRTLRAYGYYDEVRRPARYLTRDRRIVDETAQLLACPAQDVEVQHRSGTWWTVRYAREQGRDIAIVGPDGRLRREPARDVEMAGADR